MSSGMENVDAYTNPPFSSQDELQHTDSNDTVAISSSSSKSTGTAGGSLMSGLSDIVANIDDIGSFSLSRDPSDADIMITASASKSQETVGSLMSPGGELPELVSGIGTTGNPLNLSTAME